MEEEIVVFNRCTQSLYNRLREKGSNELFYCMDTGNCFLGELCLFEKDAFNAVSLNGKTINFTTHGANGTVGSKTLDLSMFLQDADIVGKADKVSGATNGNFAALDETGNIADSGKKASDFATSEQGAKADTAVQSVIVGATSTGRPGTAANVTNSGTQTQPVLDFSIPAGRDAVNPFKGWFTPSTIPTTGQTGDYCFVTSNGASTRYVWNNSQSKFVDTEEGVDTSDEQTFNTGQQVFNVIIDDTHLEDYNSRDDTNMPSLAKTSDVMALKQKLAGVTREEVRQTYTVITGFKINGNGDITPNDNAGYVEIALNGADSVRFAGLKIKSSYSETSNTRNTGYALGHYTSGDFVPDYAQRFSVNTRDIYEREDIFLDVRELAPRATHFRSTCNGFGNLVNWFCVYLGKGDTVVDLIPKIVDNLSTLDANKALSSRQGSLIFDCLSPKSEVLLSEQTVLGRHIGQNTGLWGASTTASTHLAIKVDEGDVVTVVKESGFSTIGFLSTNAVGDYDTAAPIVPVGSGLTNVRGSKKFAVPNGAHYLYVLKMFNGDDTRLPDHVYIQKDLENLEPLSRGDSAGHVWYEIGKNLVSASKYINTSNNTWGSGYSHYLIPVTEGEEFKLINRKRETGTVAMAYAFVTSNSTSGSAEYCNGESLHLVLGENKDPKIIKAPSDAKYLYVQAEARTPAYIGWKTDAETVNYLENLVNKCKNYGLTRFDIPKNNNGWEQPTTLQEVNAIRKVNQLKNIVYKPKCDIPVKTLTENGQQTNKPLQAGVLRRGIPYSSNNNDLKIVGIQVSIYTFMTAVNNPYSLLYTEKTLYNESMSAWGRTYDSPNGFSYYGTVCCGLTSSVTGKEYKLHNTVFGRTFRDFGEYIQLAKRGEVDLDNLRIGDVGNKTDEVHSWMVYGIKRDSKNAITEIVIAEASSGVTESESTLNGRTGGGTGGVRLYKFMTRTIKINGVNTEVDGITQFKHFMKTGEKNMKSGSDPYTLFRYNSFCKNTDYEESEFVKGNDTEGIYDNIPNETLADAYIEDGNYEGYEFNNEISTFAGDKASFAKGDLVVLNYNLDNDENILQLYDSIKIYKRNSGGEYELIPDGTIRLSQAKNNYQTSEYYSERTNGYNPNIEHEEHVCLLGKELEPGKYRACLAGDGVTSDRYTYWEVLDTDVAVYKADKDKYVLRFNAKPSMVYINGFRTHGASVYYCSQTPTPNDILWMQMTIHPYALSLVGGWAAKSAGKIRVSVKGEYGIATGPVISLDE